MRKYLIIAGTVIWLVLILTGIFLVINRTSVGSNDDIAVWMPSEPETTATSETEGLPSEPEPTAGTEAQRLQMSEPVYLLAEVPSQRKKGHNAPKPENRIILQASIETRKVEGKFSKKFGFWHPPKLGFGRKPQNKPHGIFEPFKGKRKTSLRLA